MDESQRREVELEVRRLLSQELTAHREALQRQTAWVTGGIGVLATIAASLFVYFIGDTKEDLRGEIARQVDAAAIAYRLDELMKSKLEEKVSLAATSEAVKEQIAQDVQATADKIVPKVVGASVKSALDRSAPQANMRELLQTYVDSQLGDVVRYGQGVALRTNSQVYIGTTGGHGAVNL